MVDLPSDIIEAAARAMYGPCSDSHWESEFDGVKHLLRHHARAALTAAAPMIAEMCAQVANEWQPIETAPKIGDFLVWMPEARHGSHVWPMRRGKEVTLIGSVFHFDWKCKPTHWRHHLPAPPDTSP